MTMPALLTPIPPGPIYGAVDLADCWGIDTSIAGILTDAALRRIVETPLPNGKACEFLWGYIPLPGNFSKWDMTAERLRAACDAGLKVLLVQHCRSGLWPACEITGRADGQHAAACAADLSYAADAHVAMDDESVRNSGPMVSQHVFGWCDELLKRAKPCVYEGVEPGLTPQQEYAIPNVDRYWGAYGPWDVATRSVCCRQSLQINFAGIQADPDHAMPDKLGGVLRAMARIDLIKAAA
jgi:hypothetical protein